MDKGNELGQSSSGSTVIGTSFDSELQMMLVRQSMNLLADEEITFKGIVHGSARGRIEIDGQAMIEGAFAGLGHQSELLAGNN